MTRRRWAYRVGQALAAIRPHLSLDDLGEALAALPEQLQPLFLAMAPRDQRHSLRVLRRLRSGGPAVEPLLAQAALLHDVGKARAPLGTAGRSLLVLAEAARAQHLVERLPGIGPRLSGYRRHPELGAAWLAEMDAPTALVEVVREHQAVTPSRPETLRLQAADGHE